MVTQAGYCQWKWWKVIGSGYNLKVKKTGYAGELNLRCWKKQAFRDDFKYFTLNT